MKTDQLINALGEDATAVPSRSMRRDTALAVIGGVCGAAILFFLTLRVRSDFGAAIRDPRVILKFVVGTALAVPAVVAAYGLARPGRVGVGLAALAISPVLLLIASGFELATSPASSWVARAVGNYPAYCVTLVPMLSIIPFAGLFYALARGAPTRMGLAGFVAGLAAGGVGATIYALHCTDDSPLFVLVWYTIAVLIMGAVGAALGPRLLRW